MELTVGIGGLGAIGLPVARALERGIDGLRLVAVAARDSVRARERVAGFVRTPEIVDAGALASADIVVEAMPAAAFESVAIPAVERGRILVTCSVGALIARMDLVDRARRSGARILVPTGALAGLDAVRALAEGDIGEVRLETRKPPAGLEGAPYLVRHGVDLGQVREAQLVFSGNAREAAAGFPANVNVAAALALAGIGPERTKVEIWADPGVTRNQHTVIVEAGAARLTIAIEGVPSEANPRTGKLTPLSVIACLRGLTSTLKVGS